MCKYVLMDLEAPLQSWGCSSRFNDRDTLDHPSKSGVLGIVFASMGISVKLSPEEVKDISSKISVDSYTLREGTILKDFQTIGTKYDKASDVEKRYLLRKKGGAIADCPTKIFYKRYLSGARFLVVLKVSDDTLAEKIQSSLRDPVWSYYLGRKCCIPSKPVVCREGVLSEEEEVKSALKERVSSDMVKAYVESPDGMPYMDDPLGGRHFGTRFVEEVYVKV